MMPSRRTARDRSIRDSSLGASTVPSITWLAVANHFVGSALFVLGLIIAAAGCYLGIFAWMNDGAAAGLELMLVTGGFGLAAVVIGFSFRVIARAHADRSPRRWWLQVLLPIVTAWIAFGLAAELSSLVEDLAR